MFGFNKTVDKKTENHKTENPSFSIFFIVIFNKSYLVLEVHESISTAAVGSFTTNNYSLGGFIILEEILTEKISYCSKYRKNNSQNEKVNA